MRFPLKIPSSSTTRQDEFYKKAALPQGNLAMPQLFFFDLKFAMHCIHYKFRSWHRQAT